MRNRIMLLLTAAFAVLIVWNLKHILLNLPDEARQDAIFRILYFHGTAGMVALIGFGVGMVFSGVYLATKNLYWDTLAAATTEVSLMLAAINLVTGSIWGRQQWGVWWAWDARLTSMLVCWLIFAGYMMLRRAIEEPDTRARLSAVVSLFGTVNAWFVYKVIEWFPHRRQDRSAVGVAVLLDGAHLPGAGDRSHHDPHASGIRGQGNRFAAAPG